MSWSCCVVISRRRFKNRVRSSKVGTLMSITTSCGSFFTSPPFFAFAPEEPEGALYVIYIENLAALAASRIKSPTSVDSDHWKGTPRGDVLLNDIVGVAGASDARMSLLTCESGWDGCRRITVGGGGSIFFAWEPSLFANVRYPRGIISLNKWDDVGESLPIAIQVISCGAITAGCLDLPWPSTMFSKSSPDGSNPPFSMVPEPFFASHFDEDLACEMNCEWLMFAFSIA